MRKLYLLAVAASAACLPGAAMAQMGPGAGHSWREGAPVAVAPPPVVQMGTMHGGGGMQHGGMRGYRHIQRGGFVPGGFWGPQFVIRNWGGYGFPQPFSGGHWIRYYDDALLIDGEGRVHDGRYGYDWNRYDNRRGHGRRQVIVRRQGDCYNGCGQGYYAPPPPPPSYGSYGYGCGCGPVVVTETTTTTAPVVEQVTTYEYVTEYAAPRARAKPKRHRAIRRAPAPARPGERG